MNPTATEDQPRKRKIWVIVFVVTLFALAVFWSVDASLVYILTGVAAFSFFKLLQNRNPKRKDIPFERGYQATYQDSAPFWEKIKSVFENDNSSGHTTQRQSKFVVLIAAGFIGFIFFTILITVIFSDGSTNTSSEARQKAFDLYNREQYDSAAWYYRIAIENDPENAELYLERGNALFNSNTDSALILYDQALNLRPVYPEAQYYKSLIYFNRKQYQNAIDEGKKALDLNSEYTDAMLLIGDGFYNQSQLDSAMQWYETAYAKGYRSAALSHMMAYIYDTKGQTQKSIPFYKEAVASDTTRTDIYTRLGELIPGEEGNWYRQKAAERIR